MSGAGLNKLLKPHNPKLQKLLKMLIMKAMIKKPMKGLGKFIDTLKDPKFWKDFKKGFSMVFKPFSKVFGPVATALGVPELGLPVEAIDNLL